MKQLFLETICLIDGEFCRLERHFSRMRATTKTALGREMILNDFPTHIPDNYKSGKVKCRILYDDHIREISFHPYSIRPVHKLRLIEANEVDYSLKYADRSALEAILQEKQTCDDVLITQYGYITDTSYSNVVFENGEGLFVPDTYLLNGVRRQDLIANQAVQVKPIRVENLRDYNRLYLINAMLGIEDAVSVETSNIIMQ